MKKGIIRGDEVFGDGLRCREFPSFLNLVQEM